MLVRTRASPGVSDAVTVSTSFGSGPIAATRVTPSLSLPQPLAAIAAATVAIARKRRGVKTAIRLRV